MEVTKLGCLAPEDARRDAVHVAVCPVIAGERLRPGWRVCLREGKAALVRECVNTPGGGPEDLDACLGIVDPFLPLDQWVMPGDRFYLCLLPGSVTGLRHLWIAPGFEDVRREP